MDEDGEILLRADHVILGYVEAEAAISAVVDDDGWFYTGDIGRLDEHGCLKITDRLKDMYIVGGFNGYRRSRERVSQHHAVSESASSASTIGDSALSGVRTLPSCTGGEAQTPQSFDAFCRQRLAKFKVPREFVFVEDVSRNDTGKIMKSELRADAAAQKQND